MKKGTILKNLWTGYEKYFVYMGFPVKTHRLEAKAVGGYGIAFINGKWKFSKAYYYVQDLEDKKHFPEVWYIDFDKMCIDGILKSISEQKPLKEE